MGNWVNLDPALSLLGDIYLWMWTNGVSLSIAGITFDIPFGELMIGVVLFSAAVDLIHIVIEGGLSR